MFYKTYYLLSNTSLKYSDQQLWTTQGIQYSLSSSFFLNLYRSRSYSRPERLRGPSIQLGPHNAERLSQGSFTSVHCNISSLVRLLLLHKKIRQRKETVDYRAKKSLFSCLVTRGKLPTRQGTHYWEAIKKNIEFNFSSTKLFFTNLSSYKKISQNSKI